MSPDPTDLERDLAAIEADVRRLSHATTPQDCQELSEALLQRAVLLQVAGRVEEAVVAYREAASRFVEASEDAIRRNVVRALQQRGHLLRGLGREVEAQASLDEAVTVGGEFARPTVAQIHAEVQRASELEADGRYEEATEVLGDIIRPWESADVDAAATMAYAMVLCARTAVRAGPNIDAALQMCDEVSKHYGDSADPGVRAMVVWSLTTKGYVHACAKRYDAAAESCARAIDYAGDNDDPRVRECVEVALEQMERWRRVSAEADA
jgi:tetratricopeptide (TPR) repeat protein